MRLPITPHLPKRSRHFSYVSGESGIWTQEPRSPGLQFSRLPPNLRNAVSGIRTHMFSRLLLGQVCIPVPPWRPKAWTEGVEPSRRTISPAGFRDQCCTSWARSTDTDGRTWTGTDCSSWVWASRVCHFATSAFYCTSRESNSAGMLRITMSKQRIVFMDMISARHCIHPIASYAFPISPSCNDPIGDRTRVYAVRGVVLPLDYGTVGWPRGIEPRWADPQSAVLPLNYGHSDSSRDRTARFGLERAESYHTVRPWSHKSVREDVRLRVSHVPDLQSGAVATGPLTVICLGRGLRPVMLFFCPLQAYRQSTDHRFYILFLSFYFLNKQNAFSFYFLNKEVSCRWVFSIMFRVFAPYSCRCN